MATDINFKINGVSKREFKPSNWKETSIELNFDKGNPNYKGKLNVTDYTFVREGADVVTKHINDGLINDVGAFEGIPLEIEVIRDGTLEVPFKGYIDLTQSGSLSKDFNNVKIIEQDGIDSLNDRASSFTFAHLFYEVGSITKNDFVSVPYVLNSIPNYLDSAIASLSVYVVGTEMVSAIERIAEYAAELAVAFDVSVVIRLIIYIIYLIGLIVALIKMLKSIISLIIQPVKYHSAMSIKKQLEKGAEYLGYTFDSDIFNVAPFDNAYIIPEKYYNPTNKKNKNILGFTDPDISQIGYFKGTYAELLDACKTIFNAKIEVDNGVIKLLRVDENTSVSTYTLPPIYNTEYRLNTNELDSNYLISFLTDSVDKNTIQQYQGTSYQVITQPKIINNKNMILMKGLKEVRIPFALAKRKTELTTVESALDDILKATDKLMTVLVKVVNKVINALNAVINFINNILKKLKAIGIKINFQVPNIPKFPLPNLATAIEVRKGMMIIENDIINVNKICILALGNTAKNNKINPLNDTYFSAKYLYDNYHYVNSFVPSTEKPNANQYLLKRFEKVPFSFNDYLLVKRNNKVITSDGKDAIIDSLVWNIWDQVAQINYRVNQLYTNNLKLNFIEPNGT